MRRLRRPSIPGSRSRLTRACPALFLLFAGCATSDDPRQGGLIGYWQHGKQGYQERLERRQAELAEEEGAAGAAQRDQASLEQRVNEQRATLTRHRDELAALRAEVASLKEAVNRLAERDQTDRELEHLERQLDDAQSELTALESDTDLPIRERTRRITALKKELRLLRERTSLLISL